MRRTIIASSLAILLIGCGGGSSDSGSTSPTATAISPTISLSSSSVTMSQGSTVSLKARVLNSLDDPSTTVENPSNKVLDFVTYTVTGANAKDVDILIYGANAGTNRLIINADDKARSYITVNVTPSTDPDIDNSNGDVNVSNRDNEIKTVSQSKVYDTTGFLESNLTITSPDSAYITGTQIDLGLDNTLNINFKLVKYDSLNNRDYSKSIYAVAIKDLNSTKYTLKSDMSINSLSAQIKYIIYKDVYDMLISSDLGELKFKFESNIRYPDSDLDGLDDKVDICPQETGLAMYNGCSKPDEGKETSVVDTKNDTATCTNGDFKTTTKLSLSNSSCSTSYITDSNVSFDSITNSTYNPLINLKFIRYNNSGQKFYLDRLSVESVSKELNSLHIIPSDKITVSGMSFALEGVEIDTTYNIKLKVENTKDDTMCDATLKLSTNNTCTDGDGDGVPDNIDYCLDTFVTSSFVGEDGCFIDSDGDGIFDKDDKCINEFGVIEFQGCPDTDGDGIPDSTDECPQVAGLPQFQGCPDTDGDGIGDNKDLCPNTPAGVSVDSNGCADSQKDSDGDGVTDDKDLCPNTPAGDSVDANGCTVVNPTPTTVVSGNPIPTPTSSIIPTGIVPTDENDEFACQTVNGYKMFINSIKDSFGVGDDYVYFRATTSYNLEFYYLPPTSAERYFRVVDLSQYNIEETGATFSLKIDSSLANGTKFYVKDTSISTNNCFKGYFPNETDLQRGIFPDKTLKAIK